MALTLNSAQPTIIDIIKETGVLPAQLRVVALSNDTLRT